MPHRVCSIALLAVVTLTQLGGCAVRPGADQPDSVWLQPLAQQAIDAVAAETGSDLSALQIQFATPDDIAAALRSEQKVLFADLMSDAWYADAALQHYSSNAAEAMLGKYAIEHDAILVNPRLVSRLFADRRNDTEFMREVYLALFAHEAMHAVQERRYDLDGSLAALEGIGEQVALDAVIEGHAQFGARRVCAQIGCSEGFAALTDKLVDWEHHSDAAVAQSRRMASARTAFSYVEGEAFVTLLHRHGGETLVDQAWAKPPSDPWVIAHPASYDKPRPLKHDMERAARQLSSEFPPEQWVHMRSVALPNELAVYMSQLPAAEAEHMMDQHRQHISVSLLDKQNPDKGAPSIEFIQCDTPKASQRYVEIMQDRLRMLDASDQSSARQTVSQHYQQVDLDGAEGFYREAKWQVGGSTIAVKNLMISRDELTIHVAGRNLEYSKDELMALGQRLLAMSASE